MSFKETKKIFRPWATIAVLGITGLLTAAQFVEPALLPALERQPGRLAHHQYWRLITPLFVHSDGWKQILFNFSAIAFLGLFAERRFGIRTWLICYFLTGFEAELIGSAWQPSGAGASVAGAGLLGALAMSVLFEARATQAKLGALSILLGAAVLTGMRDIHGPPVLTGACIAWLACRYSQPDS